MKEYVELKEWCEELSSSDEERIKNILNDKLDVPKGIILNKF